MLGKNPFRWFLFLVVAIVVARLLYNLGYRAVTERLNPTTEMPAPTPKASREGQGLRGIILDPADSVQMADTATQAR
ncbi:hypothetical protein I2I05_03580 [Hymenobacter sp. BT683]|uniref:Uncharacterized protein n=1 Tax=Hymenobacter jeongseonensis TaxID=2791027 RepID=A0ABS0IDN7_9BACT|nr:hypothetical protein [Hymenobacter jeongseonensis]MBF9236469.1 hypothetical protein [Hymenobacter jeongseonensis]